MADARLTRVLFVVSLAVTGVVAAWSAGAIASSIALRAGGRITRPPVVVRPTAAFPCRWRFDLEAGLRTGYVTAANSADCSGRQGSLTLSVRLLRWDPASKAWHTAKVQTKTWHNLGGNRYLELAKPCTVSTVRAPFRLDPAQHRWGGRRPPLASDRVPQGARPGLQDLDRLTPHDKRGSPNARRETADGAGSPEFDGLDQDARTPG